MSLIIIILKRVILNSLTKILFSHPYLLRRFVDRKQHMYVYVLLQIININSDFHTPRYIYNQ